MNPQTYIQLIGLLTELIPYITKIADDLKQSGELSAADEAALDAKIAAFKSSPYWQPDKK